jgi:hypothetical protein
MKQVRVPLDQIESYLADRLADRLAAYWRLRLLALPG